MRFKTLDLALSAQQAIVPLVRRIQRHDRKQAQQLRDATNSFVLNLGEGAYSDPGTRRPSSGIPQGHSRYQSSAGSASEVRVNLQAAINWGYLREVEAEAALAHLDRLLGSLWKLTH